MNTVNCDHRLNSFITNVLKCASLKVTSIQKQHPNIDRCQLISNNLLVIIDFGTFSEIKEDILGLDTLCLLLDLGNRSFDLLLVAPDDTNVEPLCRQLVANLQANSV